MTKSVIGCDIQELVQGMTKSGTRCDRVWQKVGQVLVLGYRVGYKV